jgi:zinc transport system substrate-binding protein
MRLGAILLVLLTVSMPAARAMDEPARVVASITPLHAIAASVMEGAGAPELLLRGTASPHSYALRPSDAARLSRAQIVFWIGPELETFLVAPLARLPAGTRVIALSDAPGVLRLPAREGGLWEDAHAHGEGVSDPHLWLDPRNGIAIAQAMAEELAAADPVRAARYRANASAFAGRVQTLDAELARSLAGVRTRPYIALHDAYHYFEERYALSPAGAVTVAVDRPAGVRRVVQIREHIAKAGVTCIFAPPQFSAKQVSALTEGLPVRVTALDDLGTTLPPGAGHYERLLRDLAANVRTCLGG